MSDQFVEFERSTDPEVLEATALVLSEAGIASRLDSPAPAWQLTQVGASPHLKPELILSVRADQLVAANVAMEAEFAREPLPTDHFLRSLSDADLLAVLRAPDEWGRYNTFHARGLVSERGISQAAVAAADARRLEELRAGRRAPATFIALGWFIAIFGGVIGVLIGQKLESSTITMEQGTFFVYDAPSRRQGRLIIIAGFTLFLVYFIVLIAATFLAA